MKYSNNTSTNKTSSTAGINTDNDNDWCGFLTTGSRRMGNRRCEVAVSQSGVVCKTE